MSIPHLHPPDPPPLNPAECQAVHAWLRDGAPPGNAALPWADLLSEADRARLEADLRLVLSEPDATGEPLDARELARILAEYAEVAGWSGAAVLPDPGAEARFRLEVPPRLVRGLRRASPAVQRAAAALLEWILPHHPLALGTQTPSRLKKLADRGVWQTRLPDGWRLRSVLDEREGIVHVVYLGPHADGDEAGRERAVIARVNRRANRNA